MLYGEVAAASREASVEAVMAVVCKWNIRAVIYGFLATAHDGARAVVVLTRLAGSFDWGAVGILTGGQIAGIDCARSTRFILFATRLRRAVLRVIVVEVYMGGDGTNDRDLRGP